MSKSPKVKPSSAGDPAEKPATLKAADAPRKPRKAEAVVPPIDGAPDEAPVRTRKRPAAKRAAVTTIPPADRDERIRAAAYFIALRRGFQSGSEHDDWLEAERQIDAEIAAEKGLN